MNELDGPRDETLSRLYRETATAEPPGRLDAVILAAARAEAGHSMPRRKPSAWHRWRLAVSFATVATLALALSLIVPPEMERAEQAMPMEAAKPRPGPPAASKAAPALTYDEARPAAQAPPPPAPVAPAFRSEAKPSKGEAAPKKPRSSVAPSPPSAEQNSAAPSGYGLEVNPWPGAGRVQPEAREAMEPADQAMPPASLGSSAPSRQRALPSSPARGLATPAPAPAGDAAKRSEDSAASADVAAPAVPLLPPKTSLQDEEQTTRSAQAWLEEIRRLRRAGEYERAAKALAAFRRAHPAFVLPEDLRSPEP